MRVKIFWSVLFNICDKMKTIFVKWRSRQRYGSCFWKLEVGWFLFLNHFLNAFTLRFFNKFKRSSMANFFHHWYQQIIIIEISHLLRIVHFSSLHNKPIDTLLRYKEVTRIKRFDILKGSFNLLSLMITFVFAGPYGLLIDSG